MSLRDVIATLGIVIAAGFGYSSQAQEPTGPSQGQGQGKTGESATGGGASQGKSAKTASSKIKSKAGAAKDGAEKTNGEKVALEKATFGGGCFWCQEAVFEKMRGVKTVVSGYAGGNVPFPTYEMVHTGLTGHAEVIQIQFDPKVVSFEELLKLFWMSHDPTTLNRQGPDHGSQYRSIILYSTEAQKQAALKSYEQVTKARAFASPIVTQLVPLTRFYPAEAYHQNYYRRHRYDPYSEEEITPKLQMLRLKLQNSQIEKDHGAPPK